MGDKWGDKNINNHNAPAKQGQNSITTPPTSRANLKSKWQEHDGFRRDTDVTKGNLLCSTPSGQVEHHRPGRSRLKAFQMDLVFQRIFQEKTKDTQTYKNQ